MGFLEGRAERLAQLQSWDQPRGRRSAPAVGNNVNHDVNVNYHRLSARAWEAVAKRLAQSAGVQMGDEDLRRAYLSVRREMYQEGQVEGRDFDGRAEPPVAVGELHDDVIPYVVNPTKW
jgi:hypothetical protein